MNGILLVAPLLVVGCPLPGQQVWKVNCQGGPGVHFTDLPQAVVAASPGDEILVYYNSQWQPCPGNPYTSPVITKPLKITGFAVGAGSGPTSTNLFGPLVIMSLPAGQRLELSGFSVDAHGSIGPGAIVALDCQGDILLENIYIDNDGSPTTFVHFERCHNVVLRGCDFTLGGYPLTVIDSSLLLTTTAIYYHAPYFTGPPFAYAATTEGIRVVNSTVTAIGSVLWGASNATSVPLGSYQERPAFVVESGLFRVGPACVVRGGLQLQSPWTAPAFQVLNPAVGSVHQDARGTIVNPPPSPTIIYEFIPATYHSWVVANEDFGVTVAGPPNGFALLALGDWLPNTPSPIGPLAMDPTTAVPIELVALPGPSGYFQWTLHCPLTAPVARSFALQALTIAPSGALGITVPSPLTVGWPHGVIP